MRTVRLTYKDGTVSHLVAPRYGGGDINVVHVDDSIRLMDCKGKNIYVNDVLYDSDRDIYFTVFEVRGGYAIEGNPVAFGLYDPADPFPVYESTGDAQTSSYIISCLEVVGTRYDEELINKIYDLYERKKENRQTT